MLHTQTKIASLLVVTLALAACPSDIDAPAAPRVDALPAVTSLERVLVTGEAEYLATVEVKSPAATATGAADADTGRFAVEVELAEGANALVVTAVDIAGNRSRATEIAIAREAPRAEQIRITLESGVVDADDGRLAVHVEVANDEDLDLAALGVTLRVEDYGKEIPAVAVTLDETGAGRAVLEGLDLVGAGRVVAEAEAASLDGVKARAEAGFFVLAGDPTAVELLLSATVDGAAVGPADAVTVPPGTDVHAAVTVTDAAGNEVTGGALALEVQGGPAHVVGSTIKDLQRAGAYRVVAHLGVGLVAGEATITVLPGAPAGLELVAEPALLAAGEEVIVTARAVDAFGNVIPGPAITLGDDVPDVDLLGGAQDLVVTPLADAVTGTMQIRTAGTFTFTAQAAGLVDASASVEVVPAAPANPDFFEIDLTASPYQAGDPVLFTYAFQDAFGNAIQDAALQVTVNAPNVLVTQDGQGAGEINGLVRAGTYVVRARAVGAGLPDDVETVTIDPNPQDAGFNLLLSSSLVAEGGTALFFATDGFGNEIPVSELTVTPSDPSISQSGNQLVCSQPGTFSVTVCLTADPSICDTEFIGVQGILDTVPPTVSVTLETPNPAVTSEVPQRGQVVFHVDAADDRGLARLSYVATFGNIGTCTRSAGPVYVAGGTTNTRFTFSFSVPGCAVPGDAVQIVAQAVDEAGNARNSGVHTPLTVQTPFAFTSPGFLITLAAWRDRLDIPQDVAPDPRTGQLVVTNFGNDRAVVVNLDRFQTDLRDFLSNRVDLIEPRGVAADAAGNLFFHVIDAGNGPAGVVRVRPDLSLDQPFIDSGTSAGAYPTTGFGMALDEAAGRTPVLCGAERAQDRVECFTSLSDAAAAPVRILTEPLGASTRPVAIAIDPPSAADPEDRLFVALDQTRALREYTFDAATRDSVTFQRDIDLGAAGVNPNELGDVVVAPVTENLIVAHRSGGRILRVQQSPLVISEIASGFNRPVGLAFDGDSLLVVDEAEDAVFRITPDPASPAQF